MEKKGCEPTTKGQVVPPPSLRGRASKCDFRFPRGRPGSTHLRRPAYSDTRAAHQDHRLYSTTVILYVVAVVRATRRVARPRPGGAQRATGHYLASG